MSKTITVIRWTIEMAASEFQIDRKTLSKRIRAADIRPGTDGKFSTEQICSAAFGDYRREQLRELRERANKLELENRRIIERWWPRDVVEDLFNETSMIVRQTLIGNEHKTLTFELVNDTLAQFRQEYAALENYEDKT